MLGWFTITTAWGYLQRAWFLMTLSLKRQNIPKLSLTFFPGLLEQSSFEMGEISTNLGFFFFLFNMKINSKIETWSSFARKTAKCLSLGSNLPPPICDAVECNSERTLYQRQCFPIHFLHKDSLFFLKPKTKLTSSKINHNVPYAILICISK